METIYNFIIKSDRRPESMLFLAHMINERGLQSNTCKSYVSAIKRTLIDDGYEWKDDRMLLGALTRACKLVNDQVKTRLPIKCNLLELLLFEIQRQYGASGQIFLKTLYQAMFALAYYGMLRIGEITESEHSLKAPMCI